MRKPFKRIGTEAGYVKGYVDGEFVDYVEDNPEQISAFILKYKFDDEVALIDIFDNLRIVATTGFIDRCLDQDYMQHHLLPVLYPMQIGEIEVAEFVPFKPTRR